MYLDVSNVILLHLVTKPTVMVEVCCSSSFVNYFHRPVKLPLNIRCVFLVQISLIQSDTQLAQLLSLSLRSLIE